MGHFRNLFLALNSSSGTATNGAAMVSMVPHQLYLNIHTFSHIPKQEVYMYTLCMSAASKINRCERPIHVRVIAWSKESLFGHCEFWLDCYTEWGHPVALYKQVVCYMFVCVYSRQREPLPTRFQPNQTKWRTLGGPPQTAASWWGVSLRTWMTIYWLYTLRIERVMGEGTCKQWRSIMKRDRPSSLSANHRVSIWLCMV